MNRLFIAPTTLPDTAPLEYIDIAAASGYDGIGLRVHPSPNTPFHPIAGDKALVRDIKAALTATGLPVFDLYSFYLRPDSDVRAFVPALELGAELGARYATVMGDDPDASRLRDRFRQLCDIAAGLGLTCSLEPAVVRPLATVAHAVELIRAVARSNAVVCLDPLNFHRGGERAADLRALDPALFPYAQITDGLVDPHEDMSLLGRMSPNRRALVGEGVVPLRDILDALPHGLPLSVELPIPKSAVPRQWGALTARTTRRFLAS
jgi:sugar phosphate isomerase/epimerase